MAFFAVGSCHTVVTRAVCCEVLEHAKVPSLSSFALAVLSSLHVNPAFCHNRTLHLHLSHSCYDQFFRPLPVYEGS